MKLNIQCNYYLTLIVCLKRRKKDLSSTDDTHHLKIKLDFIKNFTNRQIIAHLYDKYPFRLLSCLEKKKLLTHKSKKE